MRTLDIDPKLFLTSHALDLSNDFVSRQDGRYTAEALIMMRSSLIGFQDSYCV